MAWLCGAIVGIALGVTAGVVVLAAVGLTIRMVRNRMRILHSNTQPFDGCPSQKA